MVCFSSAVLTPGEVLSMPRSSLLTETVILRGIACELPALMVLSRVHNDCPASPVD